MSSEVVEKMEEGVAAGGEEREPRELYYPRRNGWNCPWHPLQVLAWAFIVFFTTTYFGFLVFYIPGAWRSIGYTLAGGLLATHILANLVTSTLDPAEASVRWRRPGKMGGFMRAVFDRKKHARVIENRYCNLCEVKVSQAAKHCSVCDKCVDGFDHHCIWLNTCIGSRNYRWFLVTVFSALLACVLLVVFTLSLFVSFFAGREGLRYACSEHFPSPSNSTACSGDIRLFGAEVPDAVFPVVVAVVGLLALVGVGMVGYLATFHVYLIAKGLTTYDYIVLQRRREQEKQEAVEREERGRRGGGGGGGGGQTNRDLHSRCWHLQGKVNRVRPTGGNDPEKGRGSEYGELGRTASMASMDSAGLANFGRTPAQSVVGSSVGDVSVISAAAHTCVPQSTTAADWMYGETVSEGLTQQQQQQQHREATGHVVVEMECQQLPPVPATTITAAAGSSQPSLQRGAVEVAWGDDSEREKPNCFEEDVESCGVLAFMSSANDICWGGGSDDSNPTETGGDEDLGESGGTLTIMSSANSIASSTTGVPTGTQVALEGDHCASYTNNIMSRGNTSLMMMPDVCNVQATSRRYSVDEEEAEAGGVSPSTSSESNDEQYESLVRSGNTVGLRALRQLSSLSARRDSTPAPPKVGTAAVVGFSNPLCPPVECEGEAASRSKARSPSRVWVSLPPLPPPVGVSLTAVPQHVLSDTFPLHPPSQTNSTL